MRRKKKVRTSDKPDFILKMKSRDRDKKGSCRIGAGWLNAAGGIGVKLNMGVVLSFRDYDEYIVTLWPAEEDDDGEIPFEEADWENN